MADYQSSHSGPTIDERVTLAATNQADIAALKLRMSSAENSINNKADTSTVNAALATKQNTLVSGTNIKTVGGQNVLGPGDIPVNDENAVKFVAQTLTDAQKAQARTNIDAAPTEEVSQLEAKVSNLSGKYYGVFTSSASLPDEITQPGYAFVGTEEPFSIWNFDGEEWADTGAEATAIYGQPGEDGVGFQTITTLQDGTMVITLTSGDTITVNLNHNHPQYPKYQELADEAAYEALVTKESDTLYLIPE